MTSKPIEPPEASLIHASALVVDTHADTPQRFLEDSSGQPWDFTSSPLGAGHINLAAARAGNLAAEFFAIWPEPVAWVGQFAHRTLALIDGVLEQVRRHPDELALCLTPGDILAARASGRFGVLMGLEGGHAIENSMALLRLYHRLGIRYMTLTWANSNEWADSCSGEQRHGGLSGFGREVIAEMNRLGMMIDVSHSSDATLADVLRTTSVPILATHSCARALCESPRNLADDQLRAIAANGGSVMVNFYSAFVSEEYRRSLQTLKPERDAAHRALSAEYAESGKPIPFYASNRIDCEFAARLPRPPLSALIAHFERIIEIAGIDHVGIGTDFDGISALPEGIDSAADLPKITAALMAQGYSAADLHKLLGGNLMRVFHEAHAAASQRPQ